MTAPLTPETLHTLTGADAEFFDGYMDAGDPDVPEPNANRSHAYRHSFAVRRAEMAGKPIPAWQSRINAAEAERKDSAS